MPVLTCVSFVCVTFKQKMWGIEEEIEVFTIDFPWGTFFLLIDFFFFFLRLRSYILLHVWSFVA